MEIIPAILESTWPEVEKKIKLVDGLTDWIQLDVSDGIFTPVKTWNNPSDLLSLNPKSKIEAHLMVSEPLSELNGWLIDPIGRIVVQVEALPSNIKDSVFDMGKEIVWGFKIETPWEPYQDLIGKAGRVLFLSVNPGFQGQSLDERVFDKIKTLKLTHPNIKIAVDGGVNLENIVNLKELGVDTAVVGSAVFGSSDPKQVLDDLKKLA